MSLALQKFSSSPIVASSLQASASGLAGCCQIVPMPAASAKIAQLWLALRTGGIPNLQAESQLTIHGFSAGAERAGTALYCP